MKQSLFEALAREEGEESWTKYVGEGGSKEAGSMTNRPAEEEMREMVADLTTRLEC